MEVILADKAGFCFGVKRATGTAFQAASKGKVYCLGPLIHNPQEVDRLNKAGVSTVEDMTTLARGDVLIIRSHGVPPSVLASAHERGLTVIDLTCPFVAKAQRHAETLAAEGYQVVVVGEKEHPEVRSILGHGGERAVAVEGPEDIDTLKLSARIGVVAQTTQSYGNFSEIVLKLLRLTNELRVFNTICNATSERQDAARALSRIVDAMIVVGGRNSANTTRLASLCREEGRPTYHIEHADEIRPEWLTGVARVGVTAGASTPDWIIEAVVQRLADFETKA
jgi:4-hydroxy-3-methylbut-2-enyl diphosphate reductase